VMARKNGMTKCRRSIQHGLHQQRFNPVSVAICGIVLMNRTQPMITFLATIQNKL